MNFVIGFIVWAGVGLLAGFVIRATYRADKTVGALTLIFGLFGAFIGGMLGTSAYIFHDPSPLRVGGVLGAILGALFFTFVYHFIARKVV
jgi:uncharacterized membrane protein YeaQ/YmgE (transglycosylase-associated protein family)